MIYLLETPFLGKSGIIVHSLSSHVFTRNVTGSVMLAK